MAEIKTNGKVSMNGHTNGHATNGAQSRFEESAEYQDAYRLWKSKAEAAPTTGMTYTTLSGTPVDMLYPPEQQTPAKFIENSAFPGQYPYTRGIHPNGYRGKIWTMRQFAGF